MLNGFFIATKLGKPKADFWTGEKAICYTEYGYFGHNRIQAL